MMNIHMVPDDLNLIIRDIREAHKKDSKSAPQTTIADELKENLEAVENFKGSRDEKLVVLYCKQLGINHKNLSDEKTLKKNRCCMVCWLPCSSGLCCGYSVKSSEQQAWIVIQEKQVHSFLNRQYLFRKYISEPTKINHFL